ncbi:hypothetical protein F4802DRAFT_592678 [Xylaria palmicola]|nr:hypothetical protein F4802DRAFT_592678 [Xylaria palmicola]
MDLTQAHGAVKELYSVVFHSIYTLRPDVERVGEDYISWIAERKAWEFAIQRLNLSSQEHPWIFEDKPRYMDKCDIECTAYAEYRRAQLAKAAASGSGPTTTPETPSTMRNKPEQAQKAKPASARPDIPTADTPKAALASHPAGLNWSQDHEQAMEMIGQLVEGELADKEGRGDFRKALALVDLLKAVADTNPKSLTRDGLRIEFTKLLTKLGQQHLSPLFEQASLAEEEAAAQKLGAV